MAQKSSWWLKEVLTLVNFVFLEILPRILTIFSNLRSEGLAINCDSNFSSTGGVEKKENRYAAEVFPIISSFLSLTLKFHVETSPEKETSLH